MISILNTWDFLKNKDFNTGFRYNVEYIEIIITNIPFDGDNCIHVIVCQKSYYIEINTWPFPYQPGYHPETPISARDGVETLITHIQTLSYQC